MNEILKAKITCRDENKSLVVVCNDASATLHFRELYIQKISQKYNVTTVSFSNSWPDEILNQRLWYTENIVLSSRLAQLPNALSAILKSDIVHVFTLSAIFATLIILLPSRRRPVLTFTGLGKLFSKKFLLRRRLLMAFLNFSIKPGTPIIAQNVRDYRYLKTHIKHAKFLMSNGSGVKIPSRVAVCVNKKTKTKTKTIGFFSRPIIEKGIQDFYSIVNKLPNVDFLRIGVQTEALEQSLRAGLTNEANIRFVPTTANPEAWITECDAILLLSTYNEGTPKLLLEAAANAKPVISYHNKTFELHVRRGCGYIAKDLTEVINIINETPVKQFQTRGNIAYEYCLRNFNIDDVIYTYEQALALTSHSIPS